MPRTTLELTEQEKARINKIEGRTAAQVAADFEHEMRELREAERARARRVDEWLREESKRRASEAGVEWP